MHTDEFEISLRRELNVCRDTIRMIRKELASMEKRHGRSTEAFLKDIESGVNLPPALARDRESWENNHLRLKRWEELEVQYQQAYEMMRI